MTSFFSFATTLAVLLISSVMNAQQLRTVSGEIATENGAPVQGAFIQWQNTQFSVLSTAAGTFQITQSSASDSVLLIIADGFSVKTLHAFSDNMSIILVPTILPEVMVSALGRSSEKEKTGYAFQQVEGEMIEKTAPLNLIGGMAGWVAGAQVVSGNTGPGSSSRIILRGESSLAGGNEPLIVVDGIPFQNSRTMGRVDYGNAASFINPSDVASVSVLKGPAASALYGARAGNGVIMITTKKGKKGQPLTIELQSEVTWETPSVLPDFQTTYGQGFAGSFAFEDGRGGGVADALDENWGPLMQGQLIPQFDSPTTNGFRGADTMLSNRGEIIATPFVSQPDQYEAFFRTGFTHRQQVSVSGGSDKSTYRFGGGLLQAEGMVPNTDYYRHHFQGSATFDLTDRLKVETTAMLTRAGSNNRLPANYGSDHLLYYFIGIGRQVNLNSLKDYWQPGLEGAQQFNSNYSWLNNPYFLVNENTNEFDHIRFTGNINLRYQLTNKIDIMLRSGRDSYTEERYERKAFSTQNRRNGY